MFSYRKTANLKIAENKLVIGSRPALGRDLYPYLFAHGRLAVPDLRISSRTEVMPLLLFFSKLQMKHLFKYLMMLMVIALGAMTTISCGGDDTPNPQPPTPPSGFDIKELTSYKWYGSFRNLDVGDNEASYERGYSYYYFLEDGKGIEYTKQSIIYTDGYNSSGDSMAEFTYEINGNEIHISNGFNLYVKFNGSTLEPIDKNGQVFTAPLERRNLEEKDYDIIPRKGKCGDNLSYVYDNIKKVLTISGNGDMYNYTSSNTEFSKCKGIKSVVIEEGVTSVGDYAFYNYYNGNSCNNIWISNAKLPSSIKRIGKFSFCESPINYVSIPENTEIIGESAFDGCPDLKTIIFAGNGKSLRIIEKFAFAVKNSTPTIYGLELSNIESIGYSAFAGCKVNSVKFGNKLKSIYTLAFEGYTGEIDIPESCENIGSYAFMGSFYIIKIGKGIKTIPNEAFCSNAAVGTMYINNSQPPTAEGIVISYGTTGTNAYSRWNLKVPKGSLSAYKAKSPWNKFKSIEEDATLTSGGGTIEDNTDKSSSINGHEYVDLGLPSGTLWATCNLGASKPEDYGDYFAWGETIGYNSGKTSFSWSTYKWGSHYNVTKYCTDSEWGKVDNNAVLTSTDDAATANWGNGWCIPTLEQIKELCNSSYTTITRVTLNGKHGFKIKSNINDVYIFLPAAGYYSDGSLNALAYQGHYRTRSLHLVNNCSAYYLYLNYSNILKVEPDYYSYRYYGYSVRPVCSNK